MGNPGLDRRSRRRLLAVAAVLIGGGTLLIGGVIGSQLRTNGPAREHQQREIQAYRSRNLSRPGSSPRPREGEVFGLVEIPRLGLTAPLVQGTGTQELKDGVGHYDSSPMPGQVGNVALAGHRTTYGAPFWDLQKLRAGDQIVVMTPSGTVRYNVTTSLVVSPGDLSVLDPPAPGVRELTLTTCHPRFTALQRLVVHATAPLEGPVTTATTPSMG